MLRNLIEASTELLNKPIVKADTLAEYKLPYEMAQLLKNSLMLDGLSIEAHTSSLKTSDTNFAVFPNQFFSFACFFYDFAKELIKYFELLRSFEDKCKNKYNAAEILFGNREGIKDKINKNNELKICFENDADIDLFSNFLDQQNDDYRLGAKNLINKKPNTPPSIRKDGFGSVILTQINLPNASSSIFGDLVYALVKNPIYFKKLKEHHDFFSKKLLQVNSEINFPEIVSLNAPKPFLLLAGISGTGKTRFVKEQAKYFRADESNYQLVSVRPDWHEPSDLLGYISRLGNNGTKYIVTDFLQFIVAAWKHIIDSIEKDTIQYKSDSVPYWLCLDEMNLAPVEQYFADYLSVIETRHWDNEGVYHCSPLLNPSIFARLGDDGLTDLRMHLGLNGVEHDALWAYFQKNGISIPPNLIVAGTVNMDETTHGFSRKVIDRAFTLDFGEFFPNDYQAYFTKQTRPKALSYPTLSCVNKDQISEYDENGTHSIAFLEAINTVLKGTPFELAYRALNELLIAVVCFMPKDTVALQAVWDDFLMTKVLPRIEGDSEKLQDDGEDSLLKKLESALTGQLNEIWDISKNRPDFLREGINGEALTIACRSKKKLDWMQKRLSSNGFTAFWP